jgi:2-aminoethylphosphonate-pyruvate transaminase
MNAIILAAGMGTRLRSVVDDCPKGLIAFDGETLVARSVRLLRAHGIGAITIVAGYRAERYHAFAAAQANIGVVVNHAFATTGSMASLAVALDASLPGDCLVLESDVVYEGRALDTLLQSGEPDATLVSGPTGAGDEVWVHAEDGAVRAMSKAREALPSAAGEFVGITRLSRAAAEEMHAAFAAFERRTGHGRMDYETGALVEIAQARRIAALVMPDLCWGEIDDQTQYERVAGYVWPRVQ